MGYVVNIQICAENSAKYEAFLAYLKTFKSLSCDQAFKIGPAENKNTLIITFRIIIDEQYSSILETTINPSEYLETFTSDLKCDY